MAKNSKAKSSLIPLPIPIGRRCCRRLEECQELLRRRTAQLRRYRKKLARLEKKSG